MKQVSFRVFFAMMLGMIVSGFAQGHSQEVSSHNGAIGTVVVKELEHLGKGNDQWVEIPGTKAAGFFADGCFVTPFENLEEFERSRTWYTGEESTAYQRKDGIRRMLEVTVGGKTYQGNLRDVGSFPMGLNLACIDFGDDRDREAAGGDLLVSNCHENPGIDMPPSTLEGTPIFDYAGKVEAVFVTDVRDEGGSFISGADLLAFLREAKKVPRARTLLLSGLR
jgi:hypothetical protein